MKEDTEKKILEAAKQVFTHKGMSGARMQEIADEAGINKALLHYYFRTKEKLFDAVFVSVLNIFFPETYFIYDERITFYNKIEIFCDKYISLLLKNPFLPNFILAEFNRKPQKLTNIFEKSGYKPKDVLNLIDKEMKKNNIKNCTPVNLLINIISMCVFPMASKHILLKAFFNDNNNAFYKQIESRKKEVATFIINSLKTN